MGDNAKDPPAPWLCGCHGPAPDTEMLRLAEFYLAPTARQHFGHYPRDLEPFMLEKLVAEFCQATPSPLDLSASKDDILRRVRDVTEKAEPAFRYISAGIYWSRKGAEYEPYLATITQRIRERIGREPGMAEALVPRVRNLQGTRAELAEAKNRVGIRVFPGDGGRDWRRVEQLFEDTAVWEQFLVDVAALEEMCGQIHDLIQRWEEFGYYP
ncbi:hypothetical protein QBC47DRAFT_400625 [Echria macrotheca]|uniref:Uncharacterized protein n=1 Tax=Echria macrotheca TaxID=438768 RepID=A0AAJ0BJF2_9PEZI|nr:hypothetical protein QBC47DRAFT_400625 [Echria macrotheca]